MALRPCRECGRDVSVDAESCPECGAPYPTEGKNTAHKLLGPKEREAAASGVLTGVGVVVVSARWLGRFRATLTVPLFREGPPAIRGPRHLPPLAQRVELPTLASPTLDPLRAPGNLPGIPGRPGRGFAGQGRQAVGPCRKATRPASTHAQPRPSTLLISSSWSSSPL